MCLCVCGYVCMCVCVCVCMYVFQSVSEYVSMLSENIKYALRSSQLLYVSVQHSHVCIILLHI